MDKSVLANISVVGAGVCAVIGEVVDGDTAVVKG